VIGAAFRPAVFTGLRIYCNPLGRNADRGSVEWLDMVFFFSRGGAKVRLETRFDNATREYVLDIVWPDRASEVERFHNTDEFQARLTVLEEQLAADHWTQVGSPELLPSGWRGPMSH